MKKQVYIIIDNTGLVTNLITKGEDGQDFLTYGEAYNYATSMEMDGFDIEESVKECLPDWDCLSPELVEKINEMTLNLKDENKQIMEDIILPILDILIEQDILTADNLSMEMDAASKYKSNLDKINYLLSEIKENAEEIKQTLGD